MQHAKAQIGLHKDVGRQCTSRSTVRQARNTTLSGAEGTVGCVSTVGCDPQAAHVRLVMHCWSLCSPGAARTAPKVDSVTEQLPQSSVRSSRPYDFLAPRRHKAHIASRCKALSQARPPALASRYHCKPRIIAIWCEADLPPLDPMEDLVLPRSSCDR